MYLWNPEPSWPSPSTEGLRLPVFFVMGHVDTLQLIRRDDLGHRLLAVMFVTDADAEWTRRERGWLGDRYFTIRP
ncbi:hypothetical protein LshimejAT787_1702150 [Lyophyllum shimeji]|uniref:Uncharacterized protein n=1 Tax=Lyophyllum shimeji TaxID=47721 RepID=A0A9P3UTG1_LYOSH|nr:hypothetical protein LshimejAT787_1702150 [Lyophyllum shimeji]